jgi:hypothetical protein
LIQDGFLCAQSHCCQHTAWLTAITSIIAGRPAKWGRPPANEGHQ